MSPPPPPAEQFSSRPVLCGPLPTPIATTAPAAIPVPIHIPQDLLSIEEAADKGTIIQFLISDAGQKAVWPTLRPFLTKGKALYFSHGFGVVYHDQTGIVPPADVDVILVAPKGSGLTVRTHFLEGRGINGSWAVHQDTTGQLTLSAWPQDLQHWEPTEGVGGARPEARGPLNT